MKTDQYVYLGIWSDSLSPDQIASMVGLEPDEVTVKASRRLDPPVPRFNSWAVECRDPGVQVSEQVKRLVERLEPVVDRLRTIASDPEVAIGLQMVRYFNNDVGCEEIEGWHLDLDTLKFLVSISASIDSDEYDMSE